MPLLGLGLYSGHRGSRWLRNRIKIFKQFVILSLRAQTNKNFILWVSVRNQDVSDPQIKELKAYLANEEFKSVFTYAGCAFWDDKYPDDEARERLIMAVHGSMGELYNVMGDAETILMTIQPSDDCYASNVVADLQSAFALHPDVQAAGFKKGYVMNYLTGELAEWNPKTNPPFFTIKFPREIFTDPMKHLDYTGPYKSHEYVGDKLEYESVDERCFLVGTHADNISTVFDHPYVGKRFEGAERDEMLEQFGLGEVKRLIIPFSLGKLILNKLPYGVKRKLRYLAGEKKWVLRPVFALIYHLLRA